jgi:putative transposase
MRTPKTLGVHLHENVARQPTDAWVAQQLREATPFGEGPHFLIRDNDKKFGEQFQHVVDGADIDILKTPVEAPRANAFCERFLGSLRRECLDHLIILNERHLRRVLTEYLAYYNARWPHPGLDQDSPLGLAVSTEGPIRYRNVLGGIIRDYYREAA